MSYSTVSKYDATEFRSYETARLFATMGFNVEHSDGKFYLRDANGDYIKDLHQWERHDPRVWFAWRERLTNSASREQREAKEHLKDIGVLVTDDIIDTNNVSKRDLRRIKICLDCFDYIEVINILEEL